MKMFDILKNKVRIATKNGHGSSPPSPTQHVESDHRRQANDYVPGFSLPVDINLASSALIFSPHKQHTGSCHNQTGSSERGYPLLNDVTLGQDHSGDSSPRPYSNASPRHVIGVCSPKLLKVLGADEQEEERIRSYIREKGVPSDQGWSTSYDTSESSSDQSTMNSPKRDYQQQPFNPTNAMTPTMLFPNKSPTAAQSVVQSKSGSCSPTGGLGSPRLIHTHKGQGGWVTSKHPNNGVDVDLAEESESPSTSQFSPATDSAGKTSPADVSQTSSPQRSPSKQIFTKRPVSPLRETNNKPIKLPPPPIIMPPPPARRTRSLTPPPNCTPRTYPLLQGIISSPSSPRPRRLNPRVMDAAARLPDGISKDINWKNTHYQWTQLPSCEKSIRMNAPQPVINASTISTSNHGSPRRTTSMSMDMSTPAVTVDRCLIPPVQAPQVLKPPQNWIRGQILGKGSFGCVFEGWNLEDGSFFAVKVSDSDIIAPEIHQEVEVLMRLKHPNIVQYYGTTTENGCVHIFLELMKMGSLQTIMKRYKVFDEVLIRTYTRQILKGLEYLHAKNTVHRDIKCANILVDSNGQVKLADFGLAKEMNKSLATSLKGSPYYMAPEVMLPDPGRKQRPYGIAVDIWSLGCTVLEMATGKPPWSGLPGFAFFFKILKGELPPIPDHLSEDAKDFILRCLVKKPEHRPTAKQLLEHRFVIQAPH